MPEHKTQHSHEAYIVCSHSVFVENQNPGCTYKCYLQATIVLQQCSVYRYTVATQTGIHTACLFEEGNSCMN